MDLANVSFGDIGNTERPFTNVRWDYIAIFRAMLWMRDIDPAQTYSEGPTADREADARFGPWLVWAYEA
jgi:hypothetical protein